MDKKGEVPVVVSKRTQTLLDKTKKTSVKEGSAYSVMEGFGARYITPYAIAVGANNTQIGLLSSIPSLFGTLSELFTLKIMNKYSRKKIVLWGVTLQAFMWLLLIGAGTLYFGLNLHNTTPGYYLILVYTLLAVFGSIASPAWTSWMRDIVPINQGEYFGKRNRTVGIVTLFSFLVASFVLDYFRHTKLYIGFIILFTIAFIGRAVSAYLFTKHYEPKFKPNKEAYFTIFQFIKRIPKSNFGQFVLYFSLISLVTLIASPFFAVYMLKNLGFSYVEYMAVNLASLIATFLFVPLWGRFADKYGNIKTMRVCGYFIILIPLLWLLAALIFQGDKSIIWMLIPIEIFSGIFWSGFNLSASNFIYDAVTRPKVAICVTYFNIFNGVGILAGATLGGFLATLNITFLGLNSILLVFLLSGIGRWIVYISFHKKLKEVREVKKFSFKKYAEHKMSHLERLFLRFEFGPTRLKVR